MLVDELQVEQDFSCAGGRQGWGWGSGLLMAIQANCQRFAVGSVSPPDSCFLV